jgi:hypothetical protein
MPSSQVLDCPSADNGPSVRVSDHPVEVTEPFDSNRSIALVDLTNNAADIVDSRMPLVPYLRDPNVRIDRNIRRMAFKYVQTDDELYR